MTRPRDTFKKYLGIFNKAICIDLNALAAFSMKKYQQQNNYVTILAKLQAPHFCEREIPDLLHIFIVNESRIALGPVNGPHFPLCHLSYSNVCVLTFKQAFCLILVKNSPKNVTRNAEFHVQVSSHTVMRVTNYVTTLNYSSQDFKGEYFKKQQSFFTA